MGLEEKAGGFHGMAAACGRSRNDSLWNVLAGEEAAGFEIGRFCCLVWCVCWKGNLDIFELSWRILGSEFKPRNEWFDYEFREGKSAGITCFTDQEGRKAIQ